jgi:hypothetical protein
MKFVDRHGAKIVASKKISSPQTGSCTARSGASGFALNGTAGGNGRSGEQRQTKRASLRNWPKTAVAFIGREHRTRLPVEVALLRMRH